VKVGCCLQRGKSQFVAPECPEKWFALQSRNPFSFSGDNPGLRPAEEFIAAKANEIDTGPQYFHRSRLVFAQAELFAGT
jgi:hypothetical protein